LLEEVRPRTKVTRPVYHQSSSAHPSLRQQETSGGEFRLGQRVYHPIFGEGIILSVEGNGSRTRVQINFDTDGTKWLMLSHANLTAS